MARTRHSPSVTPATALASKRLLESVPQARRPLRRTTNLPLALESITHYLADAPYWSARLRGLVHRYPAPFRKVSFRSADGTRISAWLGVHPARKRALWARAKAGEPREGILVVPGMFTTKDNALPKARALRFFSQLGYHVLAMDLRGFGESARVHNTGGWMEAQDVEAAIDFFRRRVNLTRLHIYAESLGAVAALNAAGLKGAGGGRLVDGSILAVSPYADARRVVMHLSRKRGRRDGFFMIQWFFTRLLHLGHRGAGTFSQYMRDAAREHGVPVSELYRHASPIHRILDVNVPTLMLMDANDPVVPKWHVEAFETALSGRENPVLWRLDWGSHCLFELQDPNWFWTVVGLYFDFFCVLPEAPSTPRAGRTPRAQG